MCVCIVTTIDLLYRGGDFRTDYARLGEIQSILSPDVNMMAVTATATQQLRRCIIHTLGMISLFVISVSPDKPNICYGVVQFKSLKQTFGPLVEKISRMQIETPRCVIFARNWIIAQIFFNQS